MTTGFDTAPATGSDAMRLFLPQSPFVQHLGITLVEIAEGQARLRMPFRPELVTVGEMVHGGALGACVDIGIMAAAWAGERIPDKLRGVTVSMSVEFLEPAQAESVDIVGTRVRQGRRLSTCAVDIVTTDTGRLIAKGLGTYQVG
ncbi:PaaI family thioesterase [Rhodococcus sp. ACT016]|uniref:PaaI family thioesterase n=1 Tax=Rhodococcus sp. ACT016 TaxID=3134808 RepID=UPI003D2BECD5